MFELQPKLESKTIIHFIQIILFLNLVDMLGLTEEHISLLLKARSTSRKVSPLSVFETMEWSSSVMELQNGLTSLLPQLALRLGFPSSLQKRPSAWEFVSLWSKMRNQST